MPFLTEIQNIPLEAVTFKFEIEPPIKPALTLNPNQTIGTNNVDMLLEKIIISPAFTQVYLCYNKPSSDRDWMIGGSEFIVNSQTATLGTYTLL